MTEFMQNATATIRKCIAVVNAIVVTRNASLTSTATMVTSGCRLITAVTVLTASIAWIRSVVSISPLVALTNAKTFIVTTSAMNSLARSTMNVMVFVATANKNASKRFSEPLLAC